MTTTKALRVLIVEDDIVDRKLLDRLLAKSSLSIAEVVYADRLSAALECLRQSCFDVVLLDLGLPDSRGTESVVNIQRRAPHVPIIVLSGLDDEATATSAVQKGVQDYLIKGQVDSTLLMRSIRYALERKKAERQLQAAEHRYRTIFDNSAVAIMMVDKAERLVSWNQFTEQLLGMSEEQLLGRSVKSLYPESEWQRIRTLSVRQKGMQHHLETQMYRGGGDLIDVDISLSVLRDSDGQATGSIGVVRDITERRRMEQALRRSEERFRQVVENANEWIWEVDANGLYTYASPIIERILGYTPEEVLGKKHFYDFFHPDDAAQLRTRAFSIFARKDVFTEFQTRNLHKDGRVVFLLRSGVPILEALFITKETSNNAVFERLFHKVYESIREGESIAKPMKENSKPPFHPMALFFWFFYPPLIGVLLYMTKMNKRILDDMVINMVDVGEETGELDTMLYKVADTYDEEVAVLTEGLMSMMEPLLIIVLGGIVGFIVIALFMPLISLITNMS